MNYKDIFVLTVKINFLNSQEMKKDHKHALRFE